MYQQVVNVQNSEVINLQAVMILATWWLSENKDLQTKHRKHFIINIVLLSHLYPPVMRK